MKWAVDVDGASREEEGRKGESRVWLAGGPADPRRTLSWSRTRRESRTDSRFPFSHYVLGDGCTSLNGISYDLFSVISAICVFFLFAFVVDCVRWAAYLLFACSPCALRTEENASRLPLPGGGG